MQIEVKTRTVYFAPTKGRHYMTKRAAARNEASALIERKYPTEREEYDEYGRMAVSGWHWTGSARLVATHNRLTKRLMRHTSPTPQNG